MRFTPAASLFVLFFSFSFLPSSFAMDFVPVGAGARAMGMGGAFIAVADDATAASWNPAGLIQLEKPEISVVGSYLMIREEVNSSSHPEASGMNEEDAFNLNYLSFAYPFSISNYNAVASLNYQLLYDIHKDLSVDLYSMKNISSQNNQSFKHKQEGGISALSPALAVQVLPHLSLGITLNIWTDQLFWDNGLDIHVHEKGKGDINGIPVKTTGSVNDEYSSFRGFNGNLGFLWNVNSIVTVGGVLKAPFTARMRHHYRSRLKTSYTRLELTKVDNEKYSEDVKLSMPMSYGLGLAFRLSDAATASLDIERTEYSKFFLEDGDGNDTSPTSGIPRKDSHVHDTLQVRTGFEYLVFREKTVIPLRAGLFYDPQPSEKHPDDFFGFSLGTGGS